MSDECTEPLYKPNYKFKILISRVKDDLVARIQPNEKKKKVLASMDVLLSLFVVAPLVIACWRGIWVVMDVHARLFPPYETFCFALMLHFGCALIKDVLHWSQHEKKIVGKTLKWKIARRVYIYIFTVICNMHWRAAWIIMDEWTDVFCLEDGRASSESSSGPVAIITLFCIIALVGMKAVRNTMGCPMFIFLDDEESFLFPTRFRVEMVQRTSLYILDCLFSVLIVGTLVVFVWRGAWVLIDIYLFPEMADWSAWASLVLGYMSVAVAFLMQPAMRWLCDRINGAARLFAADVFLLFSLFGTLNVWRGIWNLLNIYFLPDNLELSCWITHWVSLILLILLGCSNSLLVRGVYIDAEEPAGKCVVFPCYYLRLIFQQAREKKNGSSSTVQLESMSKRKQEIDAKYADGNDVKQISINMESNHI